MRWLLRRYVVVIGATGASEFEECMPRAPGARDAQYIAARIPRNTRFRPIIALCTNADCHPPIACSPASTQSCAVSQDPKFAHAGPIRPRECRIQNWRRTRSEEHTSEL